MSVRFSGTGNLGNTPALRHVDVDGEQRVVAEMRIFFDRNVKQEDGSYADGGGFWVTVSVWGWLAEAAVKLLPKGARVFASGRLRQESWETDEHEQRTQLRLDAEYITVDLLCVDQLKVRAKHQAPDDEPA